MRRKYLDDQLNTLTMETLDTAEFRITADPLRGGKITEVFPHRWQRNLLVGEKPGAELILEDGAVFAVAGWDEAFPTLEPSGDQPTLGTVWRGAADCQVSDTRLLTSWTLPPWSLTREVAVAANTLTASYAVVNTSDEALPVLWAGHALFSLEGLLFAVLPAGELVLGPGCRLAELRSQLRMVEDRWQINEVDDIGKSWKFFLPASQPVALHYCDLCVTLTTTAPWWGIWLNCGRLQTRCLGIEPTNAPTDELLKVERRIDGGETITMSWQMQVDASAGVGSSHDY